MPALLAAQSLFAPSQCSQGPSLTHLRSDLYRSALFVCWLQPAHANSSVDRAPMRSIPHSVPSGSLPPTRVLETISTLSMRSSWSKLQPCTSRPADRQHGREVLPASIRLACCVAIWGLSWTDWFTLH